MKKAGGNGDFDLTDASYFNLRGNYDKHFAGLFKVKNQLAACRGQWEDVCKNKLEKLVDFIEEYHPSTIGEKASLHCKDYKTANQIMECKGLFLTISMTRIQTEIDKNSQFVSRVQQDNF